MCDVGERHWQASHSLANYYGAREKAGSQVPVSEFCLSQFSLTTLISFPGCGGENADMPVMSFCGPTFPEYFKKCCKGHSYLVSISKYVGVLSVPRTMLLRLLSLTVVHVLLESVWREWGQIILRVSPTYYTCTAKSVWNSDSLYNILVLCELSGPKNPCLKEYQTQNHSIFSSTCFPHIFLQQFATLICPIFSVTSFYTLLTI